MHVSLQDGQPTADDADDFIGHYHALTTLLMLAHQVNSGMSAEGVHALQAIEKEHSRALNSVRGEDWES